MDTPIHIASCFDRRMELPFLVLAHSIKRHLPGDRRVILHALHSDPQEHDRIFSRDLDADFFEVRFHPVENQFDNLPARPGITTAMYIRLMIPEILRDVQRLLYLDADALALTDITPLHDTDLRGHALAAVLDYPLLVLHPKNNWPAGTAAEALPVERYLSEIVQLTLWKTYFNSGVLLMDLDLFRKNGIARAAADFLEKKSNQCLFPDQDALNHVLDGAFTRLDARWNVHAGRVGRDFETGDAELAGAAHFWKSRPWILHYTGRSKPWNPHGPGTALDKYFWHEAAESAIFPLLVGDYLRCCEQPEVAGPQRANTPWHSSRLPPIDRQLLMAHARRFRHSPEIFSASLKAVAHMERICKKSDAREIALPAGIFTYKGAQQGGPSATLDLSRAVGHIVYGPCRWYPAGNYEARFHIVLSDVEDNGHCRLVIEVTDDSDRFLAQQSLSVRDLTASGCTVSFAINSEGRNLEFRIYATGFTAGTLHFSGVTLRCVD